MTELQQYNDAFRVFLDTLNDAQRRAVDLTEGPVLVIAGPGTGKTHILTARIGKILLDTDARAQNVLCLTFTDAGVHAMRQRLLERIGPEAHRVPIATFHSFCNRVIQENMEQFGRAGLEPVSELERIGIVRQLLSKLPPEHPLREGRKDVYQYETHLRGLFSSMKKEGWSPGFVLKKTDEFLHGLSAHPDYIYRRDTKNARKGEPKAAQIQEVTEKLERLKSAADLYPKYLNAMERAGRYEYEDMLLWVAKAFEKNEALLRSYQERYQYILVDEFQDTNGAQFHLLNLLLDFWEIPNIFIVGDDDQSIYEFQGARLENLREFHRRYRAGLETIVLEENYRSTQEILDPAGRLIACNTLRVLHLFEEPLEKRLRAAQPTLASGEGLGLGLYETRLHELAGIVFQIEKLVSNGVAASEIAVIYARHRQADRLLALLEKKGIPYQTKRPVNILDLPEIQQFRELLKYLHEESQKPFSGEPRLFRLLHAAFFGLEPLDLAKIAFACHPGNQEKSGRYVRVGENGRSQVFWREALHEPAFLEGLQLSDYQKIVGTAEKTNRWIADAANMPLPHLIERLYTQSGLLAWVLARPDKIRHIQVLNTLMEFVQSEAARNPRFSLARLLDLLDSMDDNGLPMPLRQPMQGINGVQLLTAHSAKGLEFEHVFMLDCTDEAWEKNTGGNRGQFALPPTLTRSGEEDAIEARRRLFYVAMTRAKRYLHISYAARGEDGKALTRTRFIDETGLPGMEITVESQLLLDTQTLLLLEQAKPVITLPEPVVTDELLAQFSLSISALNRYLRCPLAFYYEDLLKIPGATSESAAFGTAMHGALQQFTLKMKADKKQQWPSPESLMRMFAAEMERQRGYFSEYGFTQRLALGKDYLRRIHLEQVPYWRRRAIVERHVDRVELDGVPLTGVIDKIEWYDNGTIRIVDYKTGAPDPKKTAPPDEKQAHGGDYWRQLAFYKILLENARIYPEPVGKTAISWLEPDKRGAFPVVEIAFSGVEIQFMENLIRETYANIQSRKFDTGCGKEDCPWCRMHRDRTVLDVLDRGREEGLDDGA